MLDIEIGFRNEIDLLEWLYIVTIKGNNVYCDRKN